MLLCQILVDMNNREYVFEQALILRMATVTAQTW